MNITLNPKTVTVGTLIALNRMKEYHYLDSPFTLALHHEEEEILYTDIILLEHNKYSYSIEKGKRTVFVYPDRVLIQYNGIGNYITIPMNEISDLCM